MEWAITLNEEKRYAEVVTTGVADRRGTLEMAKDIAAFAREKKIRKLLHYVISPKNSGKTDLMTVPFR